MPSRALTNLKEPLACEGFTFLSAQQFVADPSLIFDNIGVYVILLHGGLQVLRAAGYSPDVHGVPWRIGEYDHMYTGETVGVRSRLLHHAVGTCRTSNFRHTLLAVNALETTFLGKEVGDPGANELKLSKWLTRRALFGFKRCKFVADVEEDLIQRSGSPLNIRGRGDHPFAKSLSAMRKKFVMESGIERPDSSGRDYIPFAIGGME
jgi:hypothetical protein